MNCMNWDQVEICRAEVIDSDICLQVIVELLRGEYGAGGAAALDSPLKLVCLYCYTPTRRLKKVDKEGGQLQGYL